MMGTSKVNYPGMLLFLSLLAVPASALAQDQSWRSDRFMVGLGLYQPDFRTKARVDDAETGTGGTLLNLEQDLDLKDRKTQATLDVHFRFSRRHALELEYVRLSREDRTNLAFDVEYDGELIDVDEDVVTTFETQVGRLAYRFSFINHERMELAAAIGVHVTDLTVGLNLAEEANDEFNEVTAPLPTVGARFKYRIFDNWAVQFRGDWLDVEIEDINGKLTAASVDLMWFPHKNFGAAIGYHSWDLAVKANDDQLTGRVDYEYRGPKLTLNMRF